MPQNEIFYIQKVIAVPGLLANIRPTFRKTFLLSIYTWRKFQYKNLNFNSRGTY